jgi:hypothetical protein
MMLFDGNCLLPPDGCAHFFCDGVGTIGAKGTAATSLVAYLFRSGVDPQFPKELPLVRGILRMTFEQNSQPSNAAAPFRLVPANRNNSARSWIVLSRALREMDFPDYGLFRRNRATATSKHNKNLTHD